MRASASDVVVGRGLLSKNQTGRHKLAATCFDARGQLSEAESLEGCDLSREAKYSSLMRPEARGVEEE